MAEKKVEKKEEVKSAALKVVDESHASDKTTTVAGVNAGKLPKFGKQEHGV